MELTSFFELFFGFFEKLFDILNTEAVFTAFGVEVSFLQIIGAIIVLTMVISIFWRGAKG